MALLIVLVHSCHGVVLCSKGSSWLHPRLLVVVVIVDQACWTKDDGQILVGLDLEVLQVTSSLVHPCPIVWCGVGCSGSSHVVDFWSCSTWTRFHGGNHLLSSLLSSLCSNLWSNPWSILVKEHGFLMSEWCTPCVGGRKMEVLVVVGLVQCDLPSERLDVVVWWMSLERSLWIDWMVEDLW